MPKLQFFGTRAAGAPSRIRLKKNDVVKVIAGKEMAFEVKRVLEASRPLGTPRLA